MINLLKTILLFALFAGSVTFASAAFTSPEWMLMKPISTPSGVSGYVRAVLDDDVYKGSANGKLADLRIISSTGREIPYQLVSLDASTKNSYHASTMLDLSEKNGEVMFILDLGSEGLVHDRLDILSPSQNFKRQVSVYASSKLVPHGSNEWRNLTDTGYIYNFSDARAGFNAGSGEVVYPQSTSRYVRVVVHKGIGERFRVTSANVHSLVQKNAEEGTRTVDAIISQNIKEQSTEVVLDLGAPGIPTHRLLLSVARGYQDLNFDRRVVVHGSDDGINWRILNQGYISQLYTALFSGSSLAVEYPESRTRYIRAVVFNEDNTPVPFNPSVILSSFMRAIVFEIAPAESYVLYYGNSRVSAPRYDIARFFRYIDSENIPMVSFGAQVQNSSYASPVVNGPQVDTPAYFLNIVLVLLVIVVSVLLFVYVRKFKLTQPDPRDGS